MKNPDASVPSSIGVLLMDESLRPVWFNLEAARILLYPQEPDSSKALSGDVLGEKIRASFGRKSLRSTSPTELNSGRRRYLCRMSRLGAQGKGNRDLSVAVVLERSPRAPVTLSAMSTQFQLTHREQETLELLSVGLDTKEIANSLGISANTSKVYIRMVMAKMGVSSRMEVLAKILSMKSPTPKKAALETDSRYRVANHG